MVVRDLRIEVRSNAVGTEGVGAGRVGLLGRHAVRHIGIFIADEAQEGGLGLGEGAFDCQPSHQQGQRGLVRGLPSCTQAEGVLQHRIRGQSHTSWPGTEGPQHHARVEAIHPTSEARHELAQYDGGYLLQTSCFVPTLPLPCPWPCLIAPTVFSLLVMGRVTARERLTSLGTPPRMASAFNRSGGLLEGL